jgi:hypothetical protein
MFCLQQVFTTKPFPKSKKGVDMESLDFLQLNSANSSLPISGQQQGNLFTSDPLQLPTTNLNHSVGFSEPVLAEIDEVNLKVDEFDQAFDKIFGRSPKFEASTSSQFSTVSDEFDPLIGVSSSFIVDAALNSTVFTVKEQLKSFASDAEFVDKMNLAFGDDLPLEAADTLIQDLITGEAMPEIEILPTAKLKVDGAFGEGKIYLSEKYFSKNVDNPEAVSGVLLEEIGHYIDQELNSVDSPGDEGDIFARLVQDKTISESNLAALKAEDDSATLALNGEEINVELAVDYKELLPTPADNEINEGLTSPEAEFLTQLLGDPNDLNSEGQKLMVTESVGPFEEVTGLRPVVNALDKILGKVKLEKEDLYGQLTTAGTLVVRPIKGTDTYSNHSWGVAIDIRIDGVLDETFDEKTQRGLIELAPYFEAEKFYWGAEFTSSDGSSREDSMHFEASEELLAEWEAEGLLTPGSNPELPAPKPNTPPYKDYIVHEGTPIGVNPSATQFLTGDYDGDSKSDLFQIVTDGTGTNSTEVHVLSAASNYQDYIVHEGTPIGVNPSATQFLTGDYDGDSKSDLFQIVTDGTGTNSTEVHVLSAASNYQDYIVHEGTPIGVNPSATQFLTGDYDGDSKSDLFQIVTDGTGTNSTEVHVLSAASNYQDYIVHEGTPIGVNPSATQFLTGDYDGDSKSDLFQIVTDGTGTNSTEVHVLSAASNYQDYIVHEGTPIGVNPSATQFLTGDYDADGRSDLFSLVTEGTGTNFTEVHVLSDGINDDSTAPPLTESPVPSGDIEYGSYDPVAAAPEFVTEEFLSEVFAISERLNMVPEYLMAVMGHETGGSFDPAEKNPSSGAIGLIQFLHGIDQLEPSTTAEGLAAMTAVEQLDYVEQWFSDLTFSGDFSSLEAKPLEDTYLAVLSPPAVAEGEDPSRVLFEAGSTEYEANPQFDNNEDGVILIGETTDDVRKFLPGSELFAAYRDPATA